MEIFSFPCMHLLGVIGNESSITTLSPSSLQWRNTPPSTDVYTDAAFPFQIWPCVCCSDLKTYFTVRITTFLRFTPRWISMNELYIFVIVNNVCKSVSANKEWNMHTKKNTNMLLQVFVHACVYVRDSRLSYGPKHDFTCKHIKDKKNITYCAGIRKITKLHNISTQEPT